MEFKRLSDVTLVNEVADTANVLVEVDGEIKRVNKKEVGGAGGYVMVLNADNYDDSIGVCTTNYDEMYDVLMAGGSVWIDFSFYNETDARSVLASSAGPSPNVYGTMREIVTYWTITDVGLQVYDYWNDAMIYFTNGSHNLEYEAATPE